MQSKTILPLRSPTIARQPPGIGSQRSGSSCRAAPAGCRAAAASCRAALSLRGYPFFGRDPALPKAVRGGVAVAGSGTPSRRVAVGPARRAAASLRRGTTPDGPALSRAPSRRCTPRRRVSGRRLYWAIGPAGGPRRLRQHCDTLGVGSCCLWAPPRCAAAPADRLPAPGSIPTWWGTSRSPPPTFGLEGSPRHAL